MSHPMDNSSLPSESMEAKSSQGRDRKASVSRFRKSPTIQRRLVRATSFGREHIVLTVVLVLSIVQWAFVICTWKAGPAAVPGGEAHGLVPEYVTKVVRFNSTREDGRRAWDENDPAWTDIMPVGSGFVVVDGWEEFSDSLPPPMELGDDKIFSVAVFHQLHCLHYMLKEFNKLLDPSKSEHEHHEESEPGHDHSGESQEEALKHVGHCFDYLRNSLMCCGDVAFEGQGSDIDEAGTLGEASYHVCKNYDKLKAWAQASRATSMKGFSD